MCLFLVVVSFFFFLTQELGIIVSLFFYIVYIRCKMFILLLLLLLLFFFSSSFVAFFLNLFLKEHVCIIQQYDIIIRRILCRMGWCVMRDSSMNSSIITMVSCCGGVVAWCGLLWCVCPAVPPSGVLEFSFYPPRVLSSMIITSDCHHPE